MNLQTVEKEIAPVQREMNFEVGDTVKVHYKIIEGTRERVQVYEGIVIAIDGSGLKKSFTVRKISFDVGVERVFPFYSPKIAKLEVSRKSKVRRSKLYFLRERKGKSAKLKEQVRKKVEKTVGVQAPPAAAVNPETTETQAGV